MDSTDTREMTPGATAFATAFLGGGLITFGLLLSIVVWPVGILLFGIGVLFIIGSPLVWFLARRSKSEESEI